jgi:hypothetical protein
MRSLIKLTIASLAAVALFAGMASAQDKPELKVGLTLRDAFGQLTQSTAINQETDPAGEKDKSTTAESGFKNEMQSDLFITFGTPTVTARAQYRHREASEAAVSTRTDMYWKATDAFTLGFMGRSLGGIPGTAVAYGTYGGTVTGGSGMAAGGTVGPVGFFSDVTGLDFRMALGSNTVGLMVIDSCVPACGYSVTSVASYTAAASPSGVAGTVTADFTGTKADQSLIPYFQGNFGALTLGAYLVQASAKIASATTTNLGVTKALGDGKDGEAKDADKYAATSSLMDVNLSYAMGAIGIAFEYWNQSQSCVTKLSDGCTPKVATGMVVGVNVPAGSGTLRAHFVSLADSADLGKDINTKNATTDILVEYAMPMTPQFKLVPLFATRTTVTTDDWKGVSKSDKTVAASFVALGARADF